MADTYFWPESGDWIILLWILDINYKNSQFNCCQQVMLLIEIYRNTAKIKYNN